MKSASNFRRIDRDKNLTHVMCTDVLKIPRYRGFGVNPILGQIGDEPGMEGDVILDRDTGRFCWHDGLTWQCVFGASSVGNNDQFLLYSLQDANPADPQGSDSFWFEIPPRVPAFIPTQNAPDLDGYGHTVVAYGPAVGLPQVIFTSPQSNAPDLAQAPPLPAGFGSGGSAIGNSQVLGVQNINPSQTLLVMLHVVISYESEDLSGDDPEHLFWNFATTPGLDSPPSPYTTFGRSNTNIPYGDAAYNEYLVDTYTPEGGQEVTNVISMNGLVRLVPNQSVAVSVASGPAGGLSIYRIRSSKLRAEVYQRL